MKHWKCHYITRSGSCPGSWYQKERTEQGSQGQQWGQELTWERQDPLHRAERAKGGARGTVGLMPPSSLRVWAGLRVGSECDPCRGQPDSAPPSGWRISNMWDISMLKFLFVVYLKFKHNCFYLLSLGSLLG